MRDERRPPWVGRVADSVEGFATSDPLLFLSGWECSSAVGWTTFSWVEKTVDAFRIESSGFVADE
jgi:hypothetical protein